MRKLALSLVPLLFLACGREPAAPDVARAPDLAATSGWDTWDYGPFVFPMYLDCLDETVEWTGFARFRDHWVNQPSGQAQLNSKGWVLEGGTLVGPLSGTWNHVRTASTTELGGVGNLHVNEMITWENAATGQVMWVWIKVNLVVGGDGEVKLDINPSGEHYCRLQH